MEQSIIIGLDLAKNVFRHMGQQLMEAWSFG